ncbi:hybrid sensor histidine kinase/response regulator [Pseudodesulfovibrio sediminis]|uniref:histidine kinase n=1 Tax=Pseudodesulfovibrio sediminis TaxID=2810563 RepID=A0ABM7P9X1_9BACT|nr:hybrid sensor histidine kinase/response regulator [Pseudodesulfovibrio sediminis]BCS90214.1 hybrid sensor histidine kinase/response regulator [Pseudodesulfovibrio sediminis]
MKEDDSRSTILIVEGSRYICAELERRISQELGFDTHICQTQAAALEYLDARADTVFLAILGLTLPDSSEGEIVDLFCGRNIPTLVFTANMDSLIREEMLCKSILDYVIKDPNAVSNIIEYIRLLRTNQQVRILVVEDSKSFRKFLHDILSRQMYDVVAVEDAEIGMELLKDNDFTLAVVDYELPGMNGVEFTRQARMQYRKDELAILGISNSDEPMLTVRYLKGGANDFLAKPFEVEELLGRARQSVENIVTMRNYKNAIAVKNRFLGMASHDLRSPINGIKGFTELLLEGVFGEMSEEQREALENIRSANEHMLALVVDLLDLVVIEAGELQLHKTRASLIDSIALRIRIHSVSARKKHISISTECDDPGEFEFDTSRIGQVMDNLLSNALKFTPDGGSVFVTLCQRNGMAEVCVRDSGQGIPPGEEDLLFQSFQKTSVRPTAGEQSTGLGLPIVKTIVEKHGGTVWVESEYGQGAAFCFSFPMGLES